MQIKDLQIRQGNVDLIAVVKDKGNVRTFEKFGRSGKVCNCTLSDETGDVKLSLFNEDVDKVQPGDKVHIQNGWVSEWQGEKQLSAGKFGKLVVLGKVEGHEASASGGAAGTAGSAHHAAGAHHAPHAKPAQDEDMDEDLDVEEEDVEM